MGRTIAIGCLVVFVLLFIAGGVALWWFVGRPASAAVGAVQELGRIEEIREGVQETGPFAPPEDDVLTSAQVDRYLAVQESMRGTLEGRLDTLRERYQALEAREANPTPAQLAQAWSDVASILVEATRAQVDALNRQDFSLEEYRWVRGRVLEAAGYAAPLYDLPQIAGGQAEPATPERAFAPREVPPANEELVRPHQDTIEETLPFAWFGL